MKTKVIISLFAFLISMNVTAQKKAQNFKVSRTINASATSIWKVVGEDFGAIAKSHPTIVNSKYINGSLKGGEGAERVCNFNEEGTRFVHEKQISYNPEKFTFKAQVFHIDGLPMDTKYTYAIYKVIPVNENTSKLEIEMNYRTKPAFLGWMIKGKYKRTLKEYLLAVEHHIKTGETVTKDNFKSIKKQYSIK